MMDDRTYQQIIGEAQDAILQYHLHDALFLIDSLLKEVEYEEGTREFESIECDYNAMLTFLTQGGEDEGKFEQQDNLLRRTFLLVMRLKARWKMKLEGHYMREFTQGDNAFAQGLRVGLYNTKEQEEDIRRLMDFYGTKEWTQLVGAMTLNCWEYLNPKVLNLLIGMAELDVRVLTGVVIVTYRHHNSIQQLWPDTQEALQRLMLNKDVQQEVTKIQRELFVSSRSEHMQEKINNEIMPVLVEGAKDDRIRMGFEQDEEEDDFQKMMKQELFPSETKKIEEKRRLFMQSAMQLLDMQREGIDINTELFTAASRMPFFLDMGNWFKIFDLHDKAVEPIAYVNNKPNPMLLLLLEQSQICEIDKYAMVLLMGRTWVEGSMKKIMEEVCEKIEESEAIKGRDYVLSLPTREEQITNSVRTFYRLFVKSRWRTQFTNLFSLTFNPLENPFVSPIYTRQPELLVSLAQLLMKCDERNVSYQLLLEHDELEGSTADQLRMQAVCQISRMKHKQAAFLLEQADTLQPDDPSILKLMLITYGQIGQDEKRLEILMRLEELMPNNGKITTDTGLCLMKLGRFQEASQRFYKLELAGKRTLPAMRAIAWCALKQQKYDTAMRYYKKLYNTVGAATWEDYLNGGHVAWITGDTTTAIIFYHQYVKRYLTDDPKIVDALTPFDNDCEMLQEAGKTLRDICLMRELILNNEKII